MEQQQQQRISLQQVPIVLGPQGAKAKLSRSIFLNESQNASLNQNLVLQGTPQYGTFPSSPFSRQMTSPQLVSGPAQPQVVQFGVQTQQQQQYFRDVVQNNYSPVRFAQGLSVRAEEKLSPSKVPFNVAGYQYQTVGTETKVPANVTGYQYQAVRKIEYMTVPVVKVEYVQVPVQVAVGGDLNVPVQAAAEREEVVVTTCEVHIEEIERLNALLREKEEYYLAMKAAQELTTQENKGLAEEADRLRKLLEEAYRKNQQELEGEEDSRRREHEKKGGLGHGGPAQNELLEELERLRVELAEKNGLIERLATENNGLKDGLNRQHAEKQGMIDKLIAENRQLKQSSENRIFELQGQLTLLQSQSSGNVKDLLKDHEEKVRRLQKAYDDLLGEKQSFERQLLVLQGEKQSFERQLLVLQGEKQSFERQLLDLQGKYKVTVSELERQLAELRVSYESKITSLTQERDRSLRELGEGYESRIVVIIREKDDLWARIRELERIIEGLRAELETAKNTLIMYENKIAILSGELNRVKTLSENKTGEVQEIRSRAVELESMNSSLSMRLSQYESHVSSVTIKFENSLALVACLCAEIESLRGRYVETIQSSY